MFSSNMAACFLAGGAQVSARGGYDPPWQWFCRARPALMPRPQSDPAWPTWLMSLAIVAMLEFPGMAHGSVHELPPSSDLWSGVAAALQSPDSTNDDVVWAARSDALALRLADREAPFALGRILAEAVSDPRIRLEASRNAALLKRFNAQLDVPATFWSEFSLAA